MQAGSADANHDTTAALLVRSRFWDSCAWYVSFCIIVSTPAYYYIIT